MPERRQELTTEGGLDVKKLSRRLGPLVERFHRRGIHVSLFIDPVLRQLHAAQHLGVSMIELHTGRYAQARTPRAQARALHALARSAESAHALGLAVAAGHGLDYHNVSAIVSIPHIEELNIGFSIVTRALAVGLPRAVKEMVALLTQPLHATDITA